VDDEETMTLTAAAVLANVLNFVMFAMISIWYVAPWLARLRRADAITVLLWVSAFRDVALQIYSAQHFGFAASDMTRDAIVTGDLIGMVLALSAITALRYDAPIAWLLVWAFIAETVFDLVYTSYLGVREQLYESASAVTFLIVSFYVPLLWMTLILIVWQLLARRHDKLA
jgi:hypothetical protein